MTEIKYIAKCTRGTLLNQTLNKYEVLNVLLNKPGFKTLINETTEWCHINSPALNTHNYCALPGILYLLANLEEKYWKLFDYMTVLL